MSIPNPPATPPAVPPAPAGLLPTAPPSVPVDSGDGAAAFPPPPSGDGRPKGLAIVALVLALVGAILAFIPFVTWFSGAILLAAFIVALVALIGKKHGGKPLSISALIVSVVGWIISIVMSIVSFGIVGQAAIDDAVREDVSSSGSTVEDTAPADEVVDDVTAERQELVIVETAFGRSDFGSDTWWYAVVIDNPNEDYIFDFASIDVEALDASGTILDSSSDYRTILSGRTAITGTFFSVGDGVITELSVLGPQANAATHSPLDETGAFTIEGVAATADSYSTTVRGTVSGDFESEQTLVEVVVIARDSAGTIIDADFTYVDRLPVGGTKVQFEATFFKVLPADTTYEAFAAL